MVEAADKGGQLAEPALDWYIRRDSAAAMKSVQRHGARFGQGL
jgi:hypothetical protein